ncbi:MAG TPA: sigma factor, partial [Myxococcaceae bacterium]|nr:sigma factor [Myxococcaceae bacterium]
MFVEIPSLEDWNRYSQRVDPSGKYPDAGDSDEAFRAALAARDFRAAVATLMREHGTGVYRFCLHHLRERATAEDVLQLVFLQAFEALPTYQARASVRAWLLGIARHRCMDTVKGQRHRLRVVSSE